MSINIKNWAIVGGVAAAATPLVMKVLGAIPQFQITFSTIAFNVRNKITGVSASPVNDYISGLVGNFTGKEYLAALIGGAAIIIGARYLLEYQPLFKPKNKLQTLIGTFLIASVAQLLIISGLGVPSPAVIIGFLINAVFMAYLCKFVTEQFGINVQ